MGNYFVVINEKYIINVKASSISNARRMVQDSFQLFVEDLEAFGSSQYHTIFDFFPDAHTVDRKFIHIKEKQCQLDMLRNDLETIQEQIDTLEKEIADYGFR